MILAERIAAFLRQYDKGCFRDDCLKELLDVSTVKRVTAFTRRFGRSEEFQATTAVCSMCQCEKVVIRASVIPGTHPLGVIGGKLSTF